MTAGDAAYLTPEARARVEIDRMLDGAGWAVQNAAAVNLAASRGVAVREFVMKAPHGRADYLKRRLRTHVESDPRAARANEALWEILAPHVTHDRIWHP